MSIALHRPIDKLKQIIYCMPVTQFNKTIENSTCSSGLLLLFMVRSLYFL